MELDHDATTVTVSTANLGNDTDTDAVERALDDYTEDPFDLADELAADLE